MQAARQHKRHHVKYSLGLRNLDLELPDPCRWATGTTPFTPWMHGYRLRLVMAAIVTTVVSSLKIFPWLPCTGFQARLSMAAWPPTAAQAVWCMLLLEL